MVETSSGQSVRLRILDGNGGPAQERVFSGSLIQIGRGSGNDISLSDPRVSSIHGRLYFETGQLFFQDLGSTNGSALLRKGKSRIPVAKNEKFAAPLDLGDEIVLGDADHPSLIRVEALMASPAPQAQEATVIAHRALDASSHIAPNEPFEKLLALLAQLRTESDLPTLTRQVLDFLVSNLPGASWAECFMKDDTGCFIRTLGIGRSAQDPAPDRLPQLLMERLVSSHEAMLVEDTQGLPDASHSLLALPARSMLLAPLLCEKEVVGAIQTCARLQGRFSEQDLDLVTVLAQQLSALLSGARLIERLKEAQAQLSGECDYLRKHLEHGPALESMIGGSAALSEVRRQIMAVAPAKATVLILGETGVGKELVARAIHEQSPRKNATFAAVNCSALARGVLESELFGHMRGAFTGAHRDHHGLFEVAHRGTLFLDEVGEIPLDLQPKLLRVLEEGTVQPVGSSKTRRVDVRVIAATNRNLDQEVAAGRFRQDLIYRLNVFTLHVPPLRQRPEDVLPLAKHFLERFSTEHDRRHPGFTPAAAAVIQSYEWPGNVRELKNEMERSSLMAPADQPVDKNHLSERLGGGDEFSKALSGSLQGTMERLEAMVVKGALQRFDGNRTQCARSLGISRQALVAKIARLGLSEKEND